ATITGSVDSTLFGVRLPVRSGAFQLFVDDGNPGSKRMTYRLRFDDSQGKPFTLVGNKVVVDDPGLDIWSDTTTLYTRVLHGDVPPEGDLDADVAASGIISIHLLDFLRQLTTFRTGGPIAARPVAMARFGELFLGKLWDVYARQVLPWGP
ncbi:MAG TPA: hypothetical protein VI248_02060, partial [Kineosporiaceae bacterium]